MSLITQFIQYAGITREAVRKKLKVNTTRVSQLNNADNLTPGEVLKLMKTAYQFGLKHGKAELNESIVEDLRERFFATTDGDLARKLGKKATDIRNLKSGMTGFKPSSFSDMFKVKIDKIVEYYPIHPHRNKKFSLENTKEHPEFLDVLARLKEKSGIYALHDSAGNTIYLGKAEKTNFESEIKDALHRLGRVTKQLSKDKKKVMDHKLMMGDMACYFSCWSVFPKEAISSIEPMIIRACFNNILNEKFEGLRK